MLLSRLHHCCNKLRAREGEKKGTTTQGNVASGQQKVVGRESKGTSILITTRKNITRIESMYALCQWALLVVPSTLAQMGSSLFQIPHVGHPN